MDGPLRSAMPTQLAKSLAYDPKWIEVADHVDQCLREYGYYNYDLLIRPATKAEQAEIGQESGVSNFIHLELDQTECSVEIVFGASPATGDTALADIPPEDIARLHIVDALDILLSGDPLDAGSDAPGRSFKVIKGGKSV